MAPVAGMGDTSEKCRGHESAGNKVAVQGLLTALLHPVLSCRILWVLWGGRITASAHIMAVHKGPCDTLPRACTCERPSARQTCPAAAQH